MILASGTLMLSAAWLFGIWAYAVHRRPVPAAWTRRGPGSTAVTLVLVFLTTFGAGLVLAAALSPLATVRDQTWITGLMTLAAPIVAWLVGPRLRTAFRGSAA